MRVMGLLNKSRNCFNVQRIAFRIYLNCHESHILTRGDGSSCQYYWSPSNDQETRSSSCYESYGWSFLSQLLMVTFANDVERSSCVLHEFAIFLLLRRSQCRRGHLNIPCAARRLFASSFALAQKEPGWKRSLSRCESKFQDLPKIDLERGFREGGAREFVLSDVLVTIPTALGGTMNVGCVLIHCWRQVEPNCHGSHVERRNLKAHD